MATQLPRAEQRRNPVLARLQRTGRPASEERHPAVALAIALPCAVALLLLFGGWEQMVTQTKAVADLIGR
ncbi:hypothetical protein [Kitasatospora azatica]|uniref:hypothetical protein n=1 Tax=Kitasatospora azatica TaxID=58347 RepID=UPI0005695589|nr:hypothetical protein [Kitasatospora azatica]